MKKILLFIFSFLLLSCSKNNEAKNNTTKSGSSLGDEQLNITFLLDLSDRIDPKISPDTPEHYQKDMAIIDEFVSLFKADIEKKGGYKAKGRMKVIFSPKPNDPKINEIASNLNIDLSKFDWKNTKKKKNIYKSISEEFSKNLKEIYNTNTKLSWIRYLEIF